MFGSETECSIHLNVLSFPYFTADENELTYIVIIIQEQIIPAHFKLQVFFSIFRNELQNRMNSQHIIICANSWNVFFK